MTKLYLSLGALLLLGASSAWSAESAKPTDAQIAAIVVAANDVDIDAGKLALASSQNQAVKDFAQRMVTDHTSVNKSATDLVKKLNVKPDPNDTSKQLKKGGENNVTALKKLHGDAFDKAYVAQEVTYHKTVLDTVDKTLIPSAKNAELKALLEKTRPAFVAHLEHAKQLKKTLSKPASG